MELLKTETEQETYSRQIERWANEDILQLANHFHKLNKDKNQYERSRNFAINEEDLVRFNNLKGNIDKLEIHLALSESYKTKHTFFPVLKVIEPNKKEHFFKLHPVAERPAVPKEKSAEVPEIFKDMICENWDTIDSNLIDDLFTACKKENKVFKTERVKYYQISKKIVDDVIKKLCGINGITFYSGVDMNKFSDKTVISFTPVLGFKHGEQDTSDFTFGLKSILEFSKGEVFIEYSSPCPPTCK